MDTRGEREGRGGTYNEVDTPFNKNQEAHVTKDRQHEANLGNEFEPNIVGFLEVQAVDQTQQDTKTHLEKAGGINWAPDS